MDTRDEILLNQLLTNVPVNTFINEENPILQYSDDSEFVLASAEINIMTEHPEEEEKRIQSDEGDTIVINLRTAENRKEVRIGANLSEEEKEEFTQILKEYVNVFAWSYADMPGLNRDIVMHEIPTKP